VTREPDAARLARDFLAALSAGDGEAVGRLVHPEVEITTERAVHVGRDTAVSWAKKTYDHLIRRYVPTTIEERENGLRIQAELQYVWRETGDIGDSSPVVIQLGVRDGLISSWNLRDEPTRGSPDEH
jgi:ketosteroid isomerase-like protein